MGYQIGKLRLGHHRGNHKAKAIKKWSGEGTNLHARVAKPEVADLVTN